MCLKVFIKDNRTKMKINIAVLAVTILFLFLPIILNAASYYVDFAEGSDSSDGASTLTAWKHCPGDANATSNADRFLTAGDNVIFKGGVSYKGGMSVNQSGNAAGGYITYDGNSAGTWGTGKAIIDGEHVNSIDRRIAFSIADGGQYIFIRNFIIKNIGGHSDYTGWTADTEPVTGQGVYLPYTQNIIVQNNIFDTIGDWGNRQNMTLDQIDGYTAPYCIGIYVFGSGQNIKIDGNEITACSNGISVNARGGQVMKNIEICNSEIHHNIRWGIAIQAGGDGATIQDISIHHNTIRDIWQYAPDYWLGPAGTYPHFDGIVFLVGNGSDRESYRNQTLGTPDHPINIYNNYFYNNNGQNDPQAATGTSMIFLTTWGGTLNIFNNVFANPLQTYGGIYVQDAQTKFRNNPVVDYHFYNNTFYDDYPSISLRTTDTNYAVNKGTVSIVNNVFYTEDNTAIQFWWNNLSNPTELDYNSYYTTLSGQNAGLISEYYDINEPLEKDRRKAATFQVLQSLGYEAHGKYGDPQFIDISYGLGANTSSNNLAITSSSPARDAGKKLSEFADDFAGTTRPQGSAWDIGAYEYNGAEQTSVAQTVPLQYILSQNYPNPFNPATTISFSIPAQSFVSLKIYDLLGRKVATIISEILSAGKHSWHWNANNLTSGVYYAVLETGKQRSSMSMVLMK
jgi:hypothetical protein